MSLKYKPIRSKLFDLLRSLLVAKFLILTLFAISGCSLGLTKNTNYSASLDSPNKHKSPLGSIQTIVIDSGHGGRDAGARYHGLEEKVLVLDIAKRLKTILEQAGLKVVMTRDSDRFISLKKRAELANRINADLFLSIHLNANPDRHIYGAEVYYPRESVVSSDNGLPPFVQEAEVSLNSETMKHILWDMVLKRTRIESNRLAEVLCDSFEKNLKVKCIDKPARFVVLRESWMPAVLIEVGYLSNQHEAKRLGSSEYRQMAAESVAGGLIDYVNKLEVQNI